MNKLTHIAVVGDEVVAQYINNTTYGTVLIILTPRIDISKDMRIYDVQTGETVIKEALLDLIKFPFPSLKSVTDKDPSQKTKPE